MNRRSKLAYDPRVSLAVAATVVLVLAMVAGAFGIEQMSQPTSQAVLVGATAAALAVVLLRPVLSRIAQSRTGRPAVRKLVHVPRSRPDVSDVSGACALLAATVKGAVRARGVDVAAGSAVVEEGVIADDPCVRSIDVIHQGEAVALVRVFRSGRLDPADDELLETLAASAGPAIANVVWIDRLRSQIAEVERVMRQIEASRRALVTAEYEGRRRVAREVIDGLRPVFEMMRASVEGRDYDALAGECELLIDSLRSVSRFVREGVS